MQVNIVRAVNDVDIPENDAFTVVIKALLCNGALLVCVMCSLIIDFHGNEACLNFRGALLHCNVEHQHDFVSPGPGGWLLSEGERKCVCVGVSGSSCLQYGPLFPITAGHRFVTLPCCVQVLWE